MKHSADIRAEAPSPSRLRAIIGHRAVWPIVALALIFLVDGIISPGFFHIRIVEGRLGKFYEENCLYEQHFIKDSGSSLTVGELIVSRIHKFGENITVSRFARFKVGEAAGKSGSEAAPAEAAP